MKKDISSSLQDEIDRVQHELDEAESMQRGQPDEGQYFDDVIEPLLQKLQELKCIQSRLTNPKLRDEKDEISQAMQEVQE